MQLLFSRVGCANFMSRSRLPCNGEKLLIIKDFWSSMSLMMKDS